MATVDPISFDAASIPAWLRQVDHEIGADAPLTEGDRRRTTNLGRLACVLDEMSDRGVSESLLDEARRWRSRDDFEQLLDAWEAGRHPAQQSQG